MIGLREEVSVLEQACHHNDGKEKKEGKAGHQEEEVEAIWIRGEGNLRVEEDLLG